jgi:hypothetical protein
MSLKVDPRPSASFSRPPTRRTYAATPVDPVQGRLDRQQCFDSLEFAVWHSVGYRSRLWLNRSPIPHRQIASHLGFLSRRHPSNPSSSSRPTPPLYPAAPGMCGTAATLPIRTVVVLLTAIWWRPRQPGNPLPSASPHRRRWTAVLGASLSALAP